MTFQSRQVEDDDDRLLLSRGWKMIGINGWVHPTLNAGYVTKENALAHDLRDYHPIELEHEKMLKVIRQIADDGNIRLQELLKEMGYD